MPINVVVDLSHHNVHVDFNKLKAAGIVGVVHKATQGTRGIDPRYKARKQMALDVGLLWGAYHFGTGGDGSDQADHFLEVAEPDNSTMLVLDYEANKTGKTMKRDQVEEFIVDVFNATQAYPVFYTGAGMVGADFENELIGRCPLWWARYYATPSGIPCKTWGRWTFWQYTDGTVGRQPRYVEGVGFCDRDQFFGTRQQLVEVWCRNVIPPRVSNE